MIEWIIFDVGAVLIEIDLEAPIRELVAKTGVNSDTLKGFFSESFKEGSNQISTHEMYQTGKLQTDEYLASLKKLIGTEITDERLKLALFLVLGTERVEMLQLLASLKSNYKIGCFSNTTPLHWEGLKKYCKFFDQLDIEMTSFGLGEVKPKTEAYKRMLNKLNCDAASVVFIDDSERNVASAKALGINAFQFTTKEKLIADLSTIIQIP